MIDNWQADISQLLSRMNLGPVCDILSLFTYTMIYN